MLDEGMTAGMNFTTSDKPITIPHKCGNCRHWMIKQECPRERPGTGAMYGRSIGPSCEDYPCSKWQGDWTVDADAPPPDKGSLVKC